MRGNSKAEREREREEICALGSELEEQEPRIIACALTSAAR